MTSHEVNFRYSQMDLIKLFSYAKRQDVEQGGRYDARSTGIHVYTHPWLTQEAKKQSKIMGTFHFFWHRIWRIEVDEGFSLSDLLRELGTLEEGALGHKIHGG